MQSPWCDMQNMFEPWCYGQSDALNKQIDELQYPAATPEVLVVDCRGNAPPAVNEPLPVSGGVPLTGVGATYRLWRPNTLSHNSN